MSGQFITLEGIEGVGKSTLIKHIANHLKQKGINPIITKEPGGTKLGLALRQILFDTNQNIEATTELLLLFADRNQHYKEVIEPNLKKGKIVISDRFVDSTYAYQGAGRGIELKKIEFLEQFCYGEFKPNLTLWLDLDEKLAFQRVKARAEASNRFENEKLEFFKKARELYVQRLKDLKHIKKIDASLPELELAKKANELIDNLLQPDY